MNPTYDFTGQVALVTGAGSGMELATAAAFAQAGAAVVLADRDERALGAATETLAGAGHRNFCVISRSGGWGVRRRLRRRCCGCAALGRVLCWVWRCRWMGGSWRIEERIFFFEKKAKNF